MKCNRKFLICALLACLFGRATARAAEFEVLDRFSVDGYTVLRGSADIPGGSFAVGGSAFVVKNGNIGIGTTAPANKLHIQEISQTEFYGTDIGMPASGLLLEGTESGRTIGKGPSITFAFPANTDGTNIWSQARILASPNDNTTGHAIGRLYLQVRDNYNPGTGGSWNWRTGLMIQGNGYVGVGTTAPAARLQVTDSNSNLRFGYNLSAGSSGPSLMLETAANVYSDVVWNTAGADQVRLRGSSYGLAVGGTNPRLNIGYADANYTTAALAVNGSVGIGKTSPDAKLEVYDSASSSLLMLRNNANPIDTEAQLLFRLGNGGGGEGTLASRIRAIKKNWTGNVGHAADMALETYYSNAYNTGQVYLKSDGKVGIGTTAPGAKLEVNGTLKVGGSETGTAGSDIKAYIQKVMCESRRGVWVDEAGCTEYAYVTATAAAWPGPACAAGYHMCTFPDLWYGGFASLARPGYNIATPSGYSWVGGNYYGTPEAFFGPWGSATGAYTCTAGAHIMMAMPRNSAGGTPWGCYPDSYIAGTFCCSNTN